MRDRSANPGPTTKAEWWSNVDSAWDDLLEIIAHHLSLSSPAHETPGDGATPKTGRTILQELSHLKETRDSKLARYFSAVWCLASDAYAWSVPGWGEFCDLCSEEYVLVEES